MFDFRTLWRHTRNITTKHLTINKFRQDRNSFLSKVKGAHGLDQLTITITVQGLHT